MREPGTKTILSVPVHTLCEITTNRFNFCSTVFRVIFTRNPKILGYYVVISRIFFGSDQLYISLETQILV